MLKHLLSKTHEHLKKFHGKMQSIRQAHTSDAEAVMTPEPQESEKLQITVSTGTMARFVAIAILLLLLTAFLYEIRDILVIFFVSLLFAAALDPMVDALERKRVPRGIGVIIIYFLVLLILGLFVANLAPIIATEISELASRIQEYLGSLVKGEIALPSFLERFRPYIKDFFEGLDVSTVENYKDILLNFAQRLSNVAGNVVNSVLAVFNGVFNALLVLILTYLMTVDEHSIDAFILSLFPEKHAEYIRRKSDAIKEKMGYWLRGQVGLCIAVGILVYIGLFIIGLFTKPVEYSATIALLAGFTELIPYAGPFIAWLLAIPMVANQSLMLIVWLTVLMYIVQVLENNFIVPLVMHKAVGISPIFIIFAMFVGFSFLGVLGMVLAVPVATTVAIFLKDYSERRK